MKAQNQALELPSSRWSILLKYFKHQYRGVNSHGIHSPAVFDFFNHLKSKPKVDLTPIVDFVQILKLDKAFIQFQDPGRNNELRQRTISDIVSKAGKSYTSGKLLHQIVSFFQPNQILELGTSVGISALYQQLAAPQANILTVEGSKAIAEIAIKNFNKFGSNTEVVCGMFDKVLNELMSSQKKFDLVYLDGHHQKLPTLQYIALIKSVLNTEGCIILDDIHWSDGMEDAWSELILDEDVSLSIDVFDYGILWFKKGVEKQHFILKR